MQGSYISQFCRKAFRNIQSPFFFSKSFPDFYVPERQYAARKGKRAALLLAKRERKLTQVAKPKKTPEYLIRKIVLSEDQQKKRCTDENWFETQPIDNVWRTALYRGKPYTFEEAIEMFREVHHPSILNHVDAFVYTRVEVDLRMKKKDNYVESFNGVVNYPHAFETGLENKIIAICKTEEDQLKATAAGAVLAGSSSLIKQILSGEVFNDDYDYIVCHPDSYKELNVLRGLLKRNYPTAHNGLLRIDVDQAVTSFSKGMKYQSDRSAVELDFGWTDVCFGRLNMDTAMLESNFAHLLNALLKHRPAAVSHPFVTRSTLWCEKTTEKYKVLHSKYLPGYEDGSEETAEDTKEDDMADQKAA